MVTSSFWLWAAQRSFYLKHVRVSTVRRATVFRFFGEMDNFRDRHLVAQSERDGGAEGIENS